MNNSKPGRFPFFRLLAVGFILYILADMAIDYFKGAPDAPSLWLLLLSTLVFGVGVTFVCVMTWKEWKRAKQAQEEEEYEEIEDAELPQDALEEAEDIAQEENTEE